MQSALKPCPFCGGTDIRWNATDEGPRHVGRRFVCRTCHADGPMIPNLRGVTAEETHQMRLDAATEAWNRRANEE